VDQQDRNLGKNTVKTRDLKQSTYALTVCHAEKAKWNDTSRTSNLFCCYFVNPDIILMSKRTSKIGAKGGSSELIPANTATTEEVKTKKTNCQQKPTNLKNYVNK
jgi:hypothetical protein